MKTSFLKKWLLETFQKASSTLMALAIIFGGIAAVYASFPEPSQDPGSYQYLTPAQFGSATTRSAPPEGLGMFAGIMSDANLWTPHDGTSCANTEAFVDIKAGKGFCIDKTEKATAVWHDALKTCINEGKRLPETLEWQTVCKNATGLGIANTGDNYEHISNQLTSAESGGLYGQGSAIGQCSGNDSFISLIWDGHSGHLGYPATYRCVH
ncbi:MAG: hypothetical protein WCJ84_00885 [Candidatus Peregrinibacteria bacterium]